MYKITFTSHGYDLLLNRTTAYIAIGSFIVAALKFDMQDLDNTEFVNEKLREYLFSVN